MTQASLSLLSWDFVALALLTVGCVVGLRGRGRQAAFLMGNLAFLVLVTGPQAWINATSLILFCLGGYATTRICTAASTKQYVLLLVGIVWAFVYMRQYSFLPYFIPDSLLTGAFATIGLSFVFFRVLHVIVEARSGTLGDFDLLTYLNFCLAFTTLIMGPIQRYQDFRDQFEGRTNAIPLTLTAHLDAVIRILIGYVKAYVLADWVFPHALSSGLPLETMGPMAIIVAIWLFYVFLYLDFSGYCDIAIGIGSLMGVRAPENFNKPFIATDVSDFWQRQHRSLTLWLTDYVFTPCYAALRRSQSFRGRPIVAVSIALLVTMVVSGLWHGTTLSFLIFGILHGIYLVVYHLWDQWLLRKMGRKRVRALRGRPLPRALGIVITFNAVAVSFVFFQLPVTNAINLLLGLIS